MKEYHPPMHTAEHILNQTMVRLFGCERSFSNHLEKKKSKCDYHFTRALTPDEEEAIAREVNLQLSQNLEVKENWLSIDEASEKYNLKKLPGSAGDQIRIVTIGDYDACPCIGAHVSNTSLVGRFVLGSTSFDEGILRIRFKLQNS